MDLHARLEVEPAARRWLVRLSSLLALRTPRGPRCYRSAALASDPQRVDRSPSAMRSSRQASSPSQMNQVMLAARTAAPSPIVTEEDAHSHDDGHGQERPKPQVAPLREPPEREREHGQDQKKSADACEIRSRAHRPARTCSRPSSMPRQSSREEALQEPGRSRPPARGRRASPTSRVERAPRPSAKATIRSR